MGMISPVATVTAMAAVSAAVRALLPAARCFVALMMSPVAFMGLVLPVM